MTTQWPFVWMPIRVGISKSDGLIRVAAMFSAFAEKLEDTLWETPECLERQNVSMRAAWLRTIAQELALGMFDDAWDDFVKADVVEFRAKLAKIQKNYLARQEAMNKETPE